MESVNHIIAVIGGVAVLMLVITSPSLITSSIKLITTLTNGVTGLA